MASTSKATEAMTRLSLNPTSSTSSPPKANPKAKAKPKKQVVADSWEDEESSASETEAEPETEVATPPTQPDGVSAPPPTPISPSSHSYGRLSPEPKGNSAPWLASSGSGGAYSSSSRDDNDTSVKRPEKTDAVARRMIASALGVKVPRMTEEQRAYDRAVREKERKKREEEREAERKREKEAERIKAAMWDD